MKRYRLAPLFFIPCFLACALPQRNRQPTSLDNGVLSSCVSFLHTDWFDFFAHPASETIWAQADAHGVLDRDHPIIADVGGDGCLFAPNVPVGIYSPILSAYSLAGFRFYFRFPPDLTKEMQVQVKPNQFAFAGKLVINTGTEYPSLILKHIWLRIRRWAPPFKTSAATPPVDYTHLDQGSLAEAKSLRIARDIYTGSLWEDAIAGRLEAIGNPRAPLFEGYFWKRREMNAVIVSSFSYVDTLKWGYPKLIEGGAEWRGPKDKARIAVQFLEPDMKGYKDASVYLEQMREAGEPSDSHSLFSVHVSSYSGQGVRYLSYVYPEEDLPGSTARVFVTETWLIPKGPGYYLLHYRARRRYFKKFYVDFKKFVGYLSFDPKKKSSSY